MKNYRISIKQKAKGINNPVKTDWANVLDWTESRVVASSLVVI